MSAVASIQRIYLTMRSPTLSLLAAVALLAVSTPALAGAHGRTVAPPGNSAVNQYVESVPTANGSRPTDTIHPKSTGAVVGSGGSGGSGGANGSAIPTSTAHALVRQGSDGIAAEALASATAPTTERPTAGRGTPRAAGSVRLSDGQSGSPLSGVFAAFTGSAAQGGLGALLPVILILVALGSGALALWRRRRSA